MSGFCGPASSCEAEPFLYAGESFAETTCRLYGSLSAEQASVLIEVSSSNSHRSPQYEGASTSLDGHSLGGWFGQGLQARADGFVAAHSALSKDSAGTSKALRWRHANTRRHVYQEGVQSAPKRGESHSYRKLCALGNRIHWQLMVVDWLLD